MNALLIYPKFPDTFWSFKHAIKFIRKSSAFPPLGLLTVAAMLPEDWSMKLVDMNVGSLTQKDLAWADYAFMSAMTVQQESAVEAIERCKRAGVPVVAGGPLFTSDPGRFENVDHLVLNEAEITLPFFLDDLGRGGPKAVYRTKDYADIRSTPPPLWKLAEMKKYASMSIQYSRGCPFNCDFCNVTALFGHIPRIKSTQQVIRELDNLYDSGWRRAIFFVDDNFIGNKKVLKLDLLPALIEWRKGKRGVPFFTEVSINLSDDEDLMDLMAAAGFDTVFVGIETVEDKSLAECSKHQNIERNMIEDVRKIHKAGLQVQGGFIVGFDSDSDSSFDRLINFIQKSGIVTAMVGLLQAPPGTRLHERLMKMGRILERLSGDNTDCTTNIVPKMDMDVLLSKYKSVIDYLYSPKNYYKRVKTFLKEYEGPRVKAPLGMKYNLEQLRAFSRSIVQLGILGKERFYYWRLLAWTFIYHPRHFPLAVSLAIFGHHFRKIAEMHI